MIELINYLSTIVHCGGETDQSKYWEGNQNMKSSLLAFLVTVKLQTNNLISQSNISNLFCYYKN